VKQQVEFEGLVKKVVSTLKDDKDADGDVIGHHTEVGVQLLIEEPLDAQTLLFLQGLGRVKVVVGRKQLTLSLGKQEAERRADA